MSELTKEQKKELELLEENNIINWTDVDERVFKKKKKLMRWSNIYNK